MLQRSAPSARSTAECSPQSDRAPVALGAALTCEHVGGLNISTGVETDLNKVYTELAKAAGVTAAPEYAPGKVGEQRRSALINAKAIKALRWVPQWDVERGLASTVEWFRKRKV